MCVRKRYRGGGLSRTQPVLFPALPAIRAHAGVRSIRTWRHSSAKRRHAFSFGGTRAGGSERKTRCVPGCLCCSYQGKSSRLSGLWQFFFVLAYGFWVFWQATETSIACKIFGIRVVSVIVFSQLLTRAGDCGRKKLCVAPTACICLSNNSKLFIIIAMNTTTIAAGAVELLLPLLSVWGGAVFAQRKVR